MKSEVRTVASLALLYSIRMLGLFMVLPVLFIYGAEYKGASELTLGLALGIYGLTQAFFQIPLGLLSDFIGRKPVIIFGLLLFALGSLVAAFSDTIYGLIIGRALQGSGAIASTVMALVADLTSEENRTKAMASIGASIGLSFTVAIILGPAFAAFGGLDSIFILAFVLSLVGIGIVVFGVPKPQRASAGRSHRDSGAIPGLLSSTLAKPELARLNLGIFTLHSVLMAMFVAIPGLLVSHVGLENSSHWKVYLPVMLLSFIAALPAMIVAEKKRKVKPVLIAAIVLLVVAFMGLSISHGALGLLMLLFLFFVAFNLLEAMLPSLVSKVAPAGSKGTAMGLYSTSQFLGAFVGGTLGGVIVASLSTGALFQFCASFCIVWAVVALFMARPKHLSSVCFPVKASVLDLDLMAISGVEDAIYVEEDRALYLKVDKAEVDEAALKNLVEPHLI